MKVLKLIEILQKCPKDANVEIRAGYEDYCIAGGGIDEIFITEHLKNVVIANASDGPIFNRGENYETVYSSEENK